MKVKDTSGNRKYRKINITKYFKRIIKADTHTLLCNISRGAHLRPCLLKTAKELLLTLSGNVETGAIQASYPYTRLS